MDSTQYHGFVSPLATRTNKKIENFLCFNFLKKLKISQILLFKAYNKLQVHPNVRTNVSEPEPENISTEPITEILNSVANREGLSSSDVEDWLNVENELPTSPQLSDEQILESVVGQSPFEDESSDDEEDEGQDEKMVSNSEVVGEYFKKWLSWMERQNNVDTIQIMQLRRMMELLMRMRSSTLIQTYFLQHFRPM